MDDYEFWHARLAGRPEPAPMEWERLGPQAGFWRVRRGARWAPVAVWRDDAGDLRARIGGRDVPADHVPLSAAFNPISEDAYRAAIDAGRFPDEHPARPGEGRGGFTVDVARAEPIGPPPRRESP